MQISSKKLSGDSANLIQKDIDSEAKKSSVKEKEDFSVGNSRYTPYSQALLDNAANSRRVLFFYASWCPTCRPADADFQKNSDKIPSDVVVLRVNYNDPDTDQEEKDLAKKYGITYQHTFVQIDSLGNEVTKWNGGKLVELLAHIK